MNWGKGIVIFMGAFITFILILVIKLISADVDLESDDYYAREINFGKEMEAVQKAEDLDEKIELRFTGEFVSVIIPENKDIRNLELRLIRINNEELDRTYKIKDTKTFLINKKDLVRGNYRTEMYYTINGENYMQKQAFYL
jgi:hypothetical protein